MSAESNRDELGTRDSNEEARGLIASARALLQELVEEDVTRFERLSDAPLAAPPAASPAASSATSSTGGPAITNAPGQTAPLAAAATRAEETTSKAAAATRAEGTASKAATPASAETVGVAEAVPWQDGRPTLEEVRSHLGDCRRCGLCEGRSKIVFGDGDPAADLMFIGEGPGEQEDRQGLPFVGRAGELLTQMIEKGIGIPRSSVYICNIVKCRPPQNRNPLPPEVSACHPFLDGQIRAVAPKVIVTLGKPAASLLLGREIAITRMRGSWQDYQGIPLMPTLHPAYVLRQYTPENRRAVWEDLKAAYERSGA